MAFESPTKEPLYANAVVVDNSVAMRWVFDDGSAKDRRYAKRVLDSIDNQGFAVLAPYLWVYEAAFVVGYYADKEKLDLQTCTEHLNSLMAVFSVIIAKEEPSVLFEYSQAHGLSAYDAAYLLLAKSQQCPIATLDKKMLTVARNNNLMVL